MQSGLSPTSTADGSDEQAWVATKEVRSTARLAVGHFPTTDSNEKVLHDRCLNRQWSSPVRSVLEPFAGRRSLDGFAGLLLTDKPAYVTATLPRAMRERSYESAFRNSAILSSPFSHAMSNAVAPLLSLRSRSTPCLIRTSAASICPQAAALISGVTPSIVSASTIAPDSINLRAASECPLEIASCSAVIPLSPRAFTEAPFVISNSTTSQSPSLAANIRGVRQALPTLFKSIRDDNKSWMADLSPAISREANVSITDFSGTGFHCKQEEKSDRREPHVCQMSSTSSVRQGSAPDDQTASNPPGTPKTPCILLGWRSPITFRKKF